MAHCHTEVEDPSLGWERETIFTCPHTLKFRTRPVTLSATGGFLGCLNESCMADKGTTQNKCILPAPPVGGLPISQDRLDRMKLVRDRIIPIIVRSEKDIGLLAN